MNDIIIRIDLYDEIKYNEFESYIDPEDNDGKDEVIPAGWDLIIHTYILNTRSQNRIPSTFPMNHGKVFKRLSIEMVNTSKLDSEQGEKIFLNKNNLEQLGILNSLQSEWKRKAENYHHSKIVSDTLSFLDDTTLIFEDWFNKHGIEIPKLETDNLQHKSLSESEICFLNRMSPELSADIIKLNSDIEYWYSNKTKKIKGLITERVKNIWRKHEQNWNKKRPEFVRQIFSCIKHRENQSPSKDSPWKVEALIKKL